PTGSSLHGNEEHAAMSAQKRPVAIKGDFEYIRSALQLGRRKGFSMLSEFRNEPLTDFNKAENKAAMEAALQKVKEEFGSEYPVVIGGRRITGLKTYDSINPSHKDQLLGRFNKATRPHVEQAVEAAWNAYADCKA